MTQQHFVIYLCLSEKTTLAQFCVDLTARASGGLIDPVIGRKTKLQRIVQILCHRTKNNPILLGESGVGKTAIAEGLALNNNPVFKNTQSRQKDINTQILSITITASSPICLTMLLNSLRFMRKLIQVQQHRYVDDLSKNKNKNNMHLLRFHQNQE